MAIINGTDGSDSLTDTPGVDAIYGFDGDDVITSRGGLAQGPQQRTDFIYGGRGNDTISSTFNAEIWGDDGDDRLIIGPSTTFSAGFSGRFVGGAGFDTIQLGAGYAWSVSLFVTTPQLSYFSGVDGSSGSGFVREFEAFEFVSDWERAQRFNGDEADNRVTMLTGQGAAGQASFRGWGGNDTLTGADGNDELIGDNGADRLAGGSGDDRLFGGAGHDHLDGGAGFNALVGGPGDDIMINGAPHYAGVRRQYGFFNTDAGGTVTHTISGGADTGTDTVRQADRAYFLDGYFDFGTASAAAQVDRLFDTVFDRVADQDALDRFAGVIGDGGSLTDVAQSLLSSNEAVRLGFDSLSNREFVDRLFQFSVDRAAGGDGDAFVNGLDSGTLTRAQVAAQVSERAEHVGASANPLAGLWVTDPVAMQAARMYDAAFDRLPNMNELATWTSNLKSGRNLDQMADTLTATQPFQQQYGGLSNPDYVQQLYRLVLNREGEASGVDAWIASLNAGVSRAAVLRGFSESPEHQALTAPWWQDGIVLLGMPGASSSAEPSLVPLI